MSQVDNPGSWAASVTRQGQYFLYGWQCYWAAGAGFATRKLLARIKLMISSSSINAKQTGSVIKAFRKDTSIRLCRAYQRINTNLSPSLLQSQPGLSSLLISLLHFTPDGSFFSLSISWSEEKQKKLHYIVPKCHLQQQEVFFKPSFFCNSNLNLI